MGRRREWGMWAVAAAILVALLAAPSGGVNSARQGDNANGTAYTTSSELVQPGDAAALAPSTAASAATREATYQKILRLRGQEVAQAAARPQAPTVNRTIAAPDTTAQAAGTRFHGTPSTFITATKENTLADDLGRASQVTEPSAVNEGRHVLMSGNWYQSRSTDGGTTWTNLPIPAGPASAPNFCCDIDTVYDQGRGVSFRSLLYTDTNNGIVRIFVRRQIDAADACFYDIDPDGTTNNVTPDFPHLALSNNFLYLATNEIASTGGQAAKVRRLNLDQMADCVTASTTTFSMPSTTMGQRVFRPVEGAKGTMYWAALVGSTTSTTLRVWRWAESSAAPLSSDIVLGQTSTLGNTDCRGGTNNTDWWDPLTASVIGFELVGAVGGNTLEFLWDVKGDAAHVQGHIHGVKLNILPSITKASDVTIQNSTFCMGFPAISSNERGAFGLSLATGGKAGGLGPAIRAWVGLNDDFASVTPAFVQIRAGTHNPTNGRYGDYFTVHQHEPCDVFFNATNYVFTGGGGATNVDALYATFGRGRDTPCFNGWKDEDRLP
jgi:hypothetical protein